MQVEARGEATFGGGERTEGAGTEVTKSGARGGQVKGRQHLIG